VLHVAAVDNTNVSNSANASSLWLLGCIIGLSISEKLATGISFTPAFAKCLLQREDSLTLQDLVFELPAFEHLLGIQNTASGDKSALRAALSDWDIRFRASSSRAASAVRAISSDATDGEAAFSPLSRSHSASEAVTADTFDEYVKLMIRRHLVDCTSLAMAFIRDGFARVLNHEARNSLTPQSVLAALRGDIDLGHLKRVMKFTPSGNAHTPKLDSSQCSPLTRAIQIVTPRFRHAPTAHAVKLSRNGMHDRTAHSIPSLRNRPHRPVWPGRPRLAQRSSGGQLVS
jgi:hypothetical protein